MLGLVKIFILIFFWGIYKNSISDKGENNFFIKLKGIRLNYLNWLYILFYFSEVLIVRKCEKKKKIVLVFYRLILLWVFV